jgi:drug/metabolite transporter (DMT)-like permease
MLWSITTTIIGLAMASCSGFHIGRGMIIPKHQGTVRNTDVITSSSSVSLLDATTTIVMAETKSPSIQDNRIIHVQQRQVLQSAVATAQPNMENNEDAVYHRGLVTIGLITLLFASNSPILHMVFVDSSSSPPPVFLLNAACSLVAMGCMLAVGPLLDDAVEKPSVLMSMDNKKLEHQHQTATTSFGPASSVVDQLSRLLVGVQQGYTLQAGVELGVWKFLGTLANMYGLSQTSASHGAFLIQLTTLFVPLAQGLLGVPIPRMTWTAIALALTGVAIFTQDPTNSGGISLKGDVACVVAAVFYATYDLRLFHWGKLVDPLQLITTKIVTQTILSLAALMAFAWEPSVAFCTSQSTGGGDPRTLFVLASMWSGVAVNAVAPFLQVSGQQAVGPARAQILYASQPLWAALLSWIVLHETVGPMGATGGTLFLWAIYLATTADSEEPNNQKLQASSIDFTFVT